MGANQDGEGARQRRRKHSPAPNENASVTEVAGGPDAPAVVAQSEGRSYGDVGKRFTVRPSLAAHRKSRESPLSSDAIFKQVRCSISVAFLDMDDSFELFTLLAAWSAGAPPWRTDAHPLNLGNAAEPCGTFQFVCGRASSGEFQAHHREFAQGMFQAVFPVSYAFFPAAWMSST